MVKALEVIFRMAVGIAFVKVTVPLNLDTHYAALEKRDKMTKRGVCDHTPRKKFFFINSQIVRVNI